MRVHGRPRRRRQATGAVGAEGAAAGLDVAGGVGRPTEMETMPHHAGRNSTLSSSRDGVAVPCSRRDGGVERARLRSVHCCSHSTAAHSQWSTAVAPMAPPTAIVCPPSSLIAWECDDVSGDASLQAEAVAACKWRQQVERHHGLTGARRARCCSLRSRHQLCVAKEGIAVATTTVTATAVSGESRVGWMDPECTRARLAALPVPSPCPLFVPRRP